MRTWTDSSGKFKTEAALLDFAAGKVKLQKADGEVITITMSKLSVADRDYIHANRPAKSTKKNPVKEPAKKGPSNETSFGNLLGEDTPSMPSAEPVVREAVVTGVGVDAEKAEHEVITEKNAAEMFRKTMGDFRLPNLFEVTLIGEPEVIEQDDTHAKVRVMAELSPRRDNWVKLRNQLEQLLKKVSLSHAVFGSSRAGGAKLYEPRVFDVPREQRETLLSRLTGDGPILSIFKDANPSGSITTWEAFRVPKPLADVALEAGEREYQVTIALTDSEGNVVKKGASTKFAGISRASRGTPRALVSGATFNGLGWQDSTICVAALVWRDQFHGITHFSFTLKCEEIIDISLEDLRRVQKCAAVIEELK